jgi:hypothetical protein
MVDPTPFLQSAIGKKVSHVWRGHGSSIFLELGELTPRTRRDGSPGNPTGEISLMIQWSWRIERPQSIYVGSWSSERRWPAAFAKLRGATVTTATLFGRIPELSIGLSNGLYVVSFMTAEEQPAWALICRQSPRGTLHVRRGRLHVEALRGSGGHAERPKTIPT